MPNKNDLRKTKNFKVESFKEVTIDNKKYGEVSGYATTFNNVDREGDIIAPGALDECVASLIVRNRPLKVQFQHNRDYIIGKVNPTDLTIDEKGLHIRGLIFLEENSKGREVYNLLKENAVSDFSIGFWVKDWRIEERDNKKIWIYEKIELFEVSIVGEPANPEAVVTQVKNFETMKDVETLLRTKFSRNESKMIISKIKEIPLCDAEDDADEQCEAVKLLENSIEKINK